MTKTTFFFATITLLLSSCHNKSSNSGFFATGDFLDAYDSTILRIAMMPIEECATLRKAQESGLAESMGLRMKFVEYDALMDMDTAVLSGVAHIYFEDSVRMNRIKPDSLRPTMLLPIPVKLTLMADKNEDITEPSNLQHHVVGLTRLSALETWMDTLVSHSKVPHDEIYHAQINSIPIRFRMLNGSLIDAAIFPRPWSDSLSTLGHLTICDTIIEGMGFYITPQALADSTCRRQAQLLKKVYAEALANSK